MRRPRNQWKIVAFLGQNGIRIFHRSERNLTNRLPRDTRCFNSNKIREENDTLVFSIEETKFSCDR